MRIGVLSDIHGNLPALQAVWADMQRRGVDWVINLGDVVFRGPHPEECLRLVQEMGAPVVLGNTEVWLTEAEGQLPEVLSAVRAWTRARLSAADLQWLAELPEEHRFEVGGKRLLFVHGSPRGNMDSLFPGTPEPELLEALEGCEADIVLCGHTHWAFSRRVGTHQLIGTGSIGLPFDGDPRAAYLILEVTERDVGVTHVRVDYDLAAALSAGTERGFPDMDFLYKVLPTGRRD